MYNENLGSKRSEWVFVYKAKDLLPYAKKRLALHQHTETAARKSLAKMIQDPATFHRDDILQQVKKDIDRASGLREQFEVYCHEFSRLPNLEFKLALSDVVFFGMVDNTPEPPSPT